MRHNRKIKLINAAWGDKFKETLLISTKSKENIKEAPTDNTTNRLETRKRHYEELLNEDYEEYNLIVDSECYQEIKAEEIKKAMKNIQGVEAAQYN